ncbi:hypothetical protein [Nocardia terpenica]|uniref:hypothetical protein n=1 Tax=Nocardia terpenica TaxID=455432 RepID=UPI0012FD5DF5|nr:hypothetical protein [Nocardia terpenica]
MQRQFHCIADATNYHSSHVIPEHRYTLWCKAFDVESLDALFDMTPAEKAVPLFDAAITRFNSHPEDLRPLLDASDPGGLRGNRNALVGIRTFLADHGGTISGTFTETA